MNTLELFLTKVSALYGASMALNLVAVAITTDTVFGVGRAVKQHRFNSSVGIDGAIRKIAMMITLCVTLPVDHLIGFNLLAVLPSTWSDAFGSLSVAHVGLTEFFTLLYIMYEAVSILKNMYLCGLPVKWVWSAVGGFLGKYTDELPNTEKLKEREDKADE